MKINIQKAFLYLHGLISFLKVYIEIFEKA